MRFNSFEFVVFIAAFFLMFVSAPRTCRPLIAVMASYVFYAAWRASFLLLLLTTTVVDFSSALVIELGEGPARASRGAGDRADDQSRHSVLRQIRRFRAE